MASNEECSCPYPRPTVLYATRLTTGADLRKELELFAHKHAVSAGVVVTCVGNLRNAVIRMADGATTRNLPSSFEIVSLVGTISTNGAHLHISISDANGSVLGGHLKYGSIVGTTAELVLMDIKGTKFRRRFDANTGFAELQVEN